MDNLETISTFISVYGFPIVMCLILCWYIAKEHETHSNETEELHSKHLEEMQGITQALNNNTMALQRLLDYIAKGDLNNGNNE